ncbi:hypothetical protein N431DRAFT_449648 [Stipitochalara longipes BDJ]|nr:hypothetical protein N431DRAFT_449648 [Stipitochalara longipes BDJ]
MSTTICLAAPVGPANWPAAPALTNLTQRDRNSYARKLAFMNMIEQINLSIPSYQGPARPFSDRAGRSIQFLSIYNTQHAPTMSRQPYTTVHSLRSYWSHTRRDMLDLIDRHSGLGGLALLPAAPGPVVVGQQPAVRTPLPSSRPISAAAARPQEQDESESVGEDESNEDEEMEGVKMEGEKDDGGEAADLRLLRFFGFYPFGNFFAGHN